MQSWQEIKLDVPSGTIAAQAHGPENAPRVLALHGWLDNGASFQHLAAHLGEFYLVAPDLPGHGHSFHRPQGASIHFVNWAEDVVHVLDALGWDQCHLLGHSMGAAISALTAGTFPERFHRVILLEGLGPLTESPDCAPQRLRQHIEEASTIRGREHKVHATIQSAVAARRRSGTYARDEGITAIVERGMHQTADGFVWRHDPRLLAASAARFAPEHNYAFIRSITAPVLIIRAADGLSFDKDVENKSIASFRSARVIEMPGGHHIHLDDPEGVSGHIRHFFLG